MSRHEHTTKLLRLIKELREYVSNTSGGPSYGHRGINLIVADALSAVDDEMAAIDAAARAKVAKMEAALKDIGNQMTLSELSENGEDCEGDFEGAYDTLITIAREALEDKPS